VDLTGEAASEHSFGFASIEQLKSWVYSMQHRDSLDAEGFKVSVFEAIGAVGDTQCVYLRESRGENIETLDLTQI